MHSVLAALVAVAVGVVGTGGYEAENQIFLSLGLVLLALYVGSYAVLSRQGYEYADRFKVKGFYYFAPEATDSWRFRNYTCVYFFWPINLVDRCIGLGRHPASEPAFRLSL